MITRRSALTMGFSAALLAAMGLPNGVFAADLSLEFDPEQGFSDLTTVIKTATGDRTVTYRFYRAIPYVARPVDLAHQSLNIAVPLAIDGVAVDASRAPILLANNVGGYMPSDMSTAEGVGEGKMAGPPPGMAPQGGMAEAPTGSAAMMAQGERVSNAKLALAAGYVVVEPGARGRTLVNAAGEYYGTAPAAIVDLKAAVRWLRFNAGRVAGNTDQIISSGTSAGGALSSLLGATGDSPDYAPYLAELGAANASDAIFATGAWCPITDLDHADMAYEWNWGANPAAKGAVDPALSSQLALAFADYQAGLGLQGQGGFGPLTAESYGEYLLQTYLQPAATAHLAALTGADRAAYLAANPHITWADGQAQFGWIDFLAHVGTRKKTVPAFDALDLSSGENNLFGQGTTKGRHFTAFALQATGAGTQIDADLPEKLRLMNPMPYLAMGHAGRSRHWWLRVGAKDSDTSLTVLSNLAAAASALGDEVNTRYYWDAGHGANEDAAEFLAWIGDITGHQPL